jgi:hypothetical protein
MFLSALVVFPSVQRKLDVISLTLFRSAAKKNDPPPVFPEIHAVTRAEMDLALKNTSPNAFDVGEVPESYTI